MKKCGIIFNMCKGVDASYSSWRKTMTKGVCLQNKLPVTVFCPSVRLLQKSSTMDTRRRSCRWKPDSLFHQSCQYTMSWDPWWYRNGSMNHCKQPISTLVIYVNSSGGESQQFASLNLTCKSFSDSSSAFAVVTLDFRVSYCRMAAAPKEQPVNWHGVRQQPTASFYPKPKYCMHLLFIILVEEWKDLLLLWTSGVLKVSVGGLWEEVGDLVCQPQKVKLLFLGWHFLSLYPAFWLPDGNCTSVGCGGSVCQTKRVDTQC